MSTPRPPRLFARFFQWYCNPRLQEAILGDMEEQFEEDIETHGLNKARRRFAWTVIRFFRKDIIKPLSGTQKLNYYGMLKNYFITSIRFIKREKVFALMNISGLALGIACAIVIYKILDHEYSYNKHQQHYANLYRVLNEDITTRGKLLYRAQTNPLAGAIRSDFTGVNATMTFYDRDGLIGIPDGEGNIQRFQENKGVVFVEPQFLEMFTLRFLVGDQKSALSEQGKVILTESKAKKYFGLSSFNLHEAIGREVILENEKTLYVSAVVEDEPNTSDFPFEVIFHHMDQDAANPWFRNGQDWDEYNSATNCYVLLDKGVNPNDFEKQLETIVDKYLPKHAAENRTYRLQPFSDLHYSGEVRSTYAGITSTKNELMILGLVGLFLIITACINFVNLSTAQAVKRSKEVGVRKTMGSSRSQLMIQFLCETFLITVLATICALFLASFLVGEVADIFKYEMQLDIMSDVQIIYFLLSLILGVTIVAGIYPSLILARMNPVLAIKNSLNVKQTSGFLSLRKGLVVLQFAISQILIISILILKAQMDFFQTKDLGFNDESIVVVDLPENDSTRLSVLKSELLSHSSVSKVSLSTSGPMASWRSTNPIFHPNIEGQDVSGNLKNVDEDYFDLYEMEFLAGEPFKATDPQNYVVINRQMTKVLGFEDPHDALGERIKYGRGSLEMIVVGVVKDFHTASLHAEIDNVFLANYSWNIFQANIKLHSSENSFSEFKHALNHIEESWEAQFPEHVFDFDFYDEQLAAMYTLELSVAKVFRIFVIIAILIGALGLYGLVSFIANQKTKEIGIRKVMGASEMAIWNIFSKEFVLLLTIAFFISAPVSFYLMNAFLDTYAYRITLGSKFFIAAILLSMVIAFLTVGYKSLRVARANPIDALKDE
ncbi:ABC-type antimicrobial peptide transport system, permease component [Ekhidna lutea]|uniref:ABC-type antimicrobial peptide transport system, permease component n=1 Tax=Ekhidna lutea TaxID=447679 RepID=A0A239EFB6_EKHLU|nr:FtsX-like permease family protein [Ekhidna lutea]SNS42604.1 ABC-type antimicrobial peptide transport system, permease component [Ekhidna lutea]